MIVAVVSTIVLALVGLTAAVLIGETRRQEALLAEQESKGTAHLLPTT